MGTHEKENNKKETLRPLVVADVHEFADKWFLIAVMYEEGYVVAEVVTPLDRLFRHGGNIPNKLRQMVALNANNPTASFDVMTNTKVIHGELLEHPDMLCQLVESKMTTETKRTIDNPHVQEGILGLLEDDENEQLHELAEARASRKKAAEQIVAAAPQETKRSLFDKICDWFAKARRDLKV
ncbi:hypothetical protein [Bacillus wiedmannii]|uniref:hypothetical protein n=1 Tax=Bacillus wiedmannii TaxID=1890302 RepID=UPI000BFE562E|nr:hypothetical protein [Bacillus wiedmannii]PHG78321.1 hypothetical protein COI50_11235 [Bacillus wiedmannii]